MVLNVHRNHKAYRGRGEGGTGVWRWGWGGGAGGGTQCQLASLDLYLLYPLSNTDHLRKEQYDPSNHRHLPHHQHSFFFSITTNTYQLRSNQTNCFLFNARIRFESSCSPSINSVPHGARSTACEDTGGAYI